MSAIIKEVYDAFRSAGVSEEQAAAAASAIPPNADLATKSDISALHSEFNRDITEVRSEIRKLRADTRADLKELELRMTLKLFAALGMAVAGIKALDFLIG